MAHALAERFGLQIRAEKAQAVDALLKKSRTWLLIGGGGELEFRRLLEEAQSLAERDFALLQKHKRAVAVKTLLKGGAK